MRDLSPDPLPREPRRHDRACALHLAVHVSLPQPVIGRVSINADSRARSQRSEPLRRLPLPCFYSSLPTSPAPPRQRLALRRITFTNLGHTEHRQQGGARRSQDVSMRLTSSRICSRTSFTDFSHGQSHGSCVSGGCLHQPAFFVEMSG